MSTPNDHHAELVNALAAASGDERLELLLKLCAACRADAPDDSLAYGRQALEAARNSGDDMLRARARRELGKTCYYLGNYQEALEQWQAELALQRAAANRKGEQ